MLSRQRRVRDFSWLFLCAGFAALLAVLPTVTPLARQALFAGQLPLYFPGSVCFSVEIVSEAESE